MGPMTFNPLCLDGAAGFPHEHPSPDTRKRGTGSVSPVGASAASPSLPIGPLSASQRSCFQFASWNSGRAWNVFHHGISLPSKSIFNEQAPPHSHHQPFSLNCKQGFSESGVLPLKHSRGFCWEVRKVLAVGSAAVGGSYCFKQGSDFCIMFCFQLWLSY